MEFKITENGIKTETGYGELVISGDESYGFRPYQLMIASLAGCSASVMRKIFLKKKLKIEDITIQADVTREVEEPKKIEKVHLHFLIKGDNLEGKMDRILALTRKYCSMVQSVEKQIEVVETYELV
ncbi:OsmC family protein [Terrilactibacillus laevilacticus]|uniref:OsmC family protein n=1 Tax=Terrilactibacillus laevilacticus TaxID=1380157 RepID=A0ABW5PV21_9BACI|nr:OsmC family protein [Terrilactibacillus laevilacticus]